MNPILLEIFIKIAEQRHDGHFTIFKFTTNWRCGFGTISPEYRLDENYRQINDVEDMACGETLNTAIAECIKKELDTMV